MTQTARGTLGEYQFQAARATGSETDTASDNTVIGLLKSISAEGVVNATLTYTRTSGTITAGGTSQEALTTDPSTKEVVVFNPSTETETLNVGIGEAAANDGTSIGVMPGTALVVNTIQSINVNAATTGHKFVILKGV